MNNNLLIKKNIFYSTGTRIIILMIGIIMPRLVITSFGSEINGLLSTVSQIFVYLALVEGGIGNSAVNALYAPLGKKDYKEANNVVNEAVAYYRKVSLIYGFGIIAFSIIYPLVVNTTIDRIIVFEIIILQGASNFINYYFTAVYEQLLLADGKNYVSQNINFVLYVFSAIIKITLILMGFDVIAVQVGYFVISCVKAPMVIELCKKKYIWLNRIKSVSIGTYLKERNAFIIHEVSNTIFSQTDIFIISTFCSLSLASVYSVYSLIYTSLNGLLNTANGGLGFILAQNYKENYNKFLSVYDAYSILYSCVTFILFTTAFVLTKPFIKLYTRGITDIDYIILGLPLMFSLINLLSGVRAVAARLIVVTGHAERTKNRSIAEALINLSTSLLLVNIMGIKGVLLGTIIALLYRSNDIIIYANCRILHRNPLYEYKNILINFLIFIFANLFVWKMPLTITTYMQFILAGFVTMILVTLLYATINLIVNFRLFNSLLKVKRQAH